jgi:hypothetical protein
MIIAYFCSSVDKNFSFSKYYCETRTRLLANLAARLNNSDTSLLAAYTLACMEYDQNTALGPEFDSEDPTKHMLRFAWHFKRHPEHYIVLSQTRTDALKVNTTRYLASIRNSVQWDNTKLAATQALFDFSFAGGLDALNAAATKGMKKRIRGKGKDKMRGLGWPANRRPGPTFFAPKLPTFSYESSLIQEHCRGSLLLQGLVADMPGVGNVGAHVEIFDIGNLSGFNMLGLDEPDDSYEDDLEEMFAEDDDAMEDDDSACIIDSADLSFWVSKAQSGL